MEKETDVVLCIQQCVCNVVECVVTVVIVRSNDESVAIVTADNVCNIKSQ